MTPELTALALAGILHCGLFALFAIPANLELGTAYTTSPRDIPPPRSLSIGTARLQRTLNNSFEGLILFTLAVVVVTLGARTSTTTHACAWIFLATRLLYIPAYAFGWAPLRSAIWCAGFVACLTMLVVALI